MSDPGATLVTEKPRPFLPAYGRAAVLGVALGELIVLVVLALYGLRAALFVGAGLGYLTLCLARPTAAWLAVIIVFPFSVETVIPGTSSALQAPTEPMILILEATWILRILAGRPLHIEKSRLTLAIIIVLAAAFFSCLYSGYRLHSLKASVNLLWYVFFGYFLAVEGLRSRESLRMFAIAFCIPAVIVSGYYLVNLARLGLSVRASNVAANPFFPEHGTFSAYLSFALPLAVAAMLTARGFLARVVYGSAGALILATVVLSLTRAAWLGLVAAAATAFAGSLRFRGSRAVMIGAVVAAVLVAALAISHSASTLSEHVQSVTNVKTDISNLERLNRWMAGVQIFRAHPLTGVGFGAYKYHYPEYRLIRLATTESGAVGGAHNEYLTILSENGLIGTAAGLFFTLAFLSLAARALRPHHLPERTARPLAGMALALVAGLVSYAVHGFFNNYLTYDKAAVPVWTFIGALAACASLAVSPETPSRGGPDAP